MVKLEEGWLTVALLAAMIAEMRGGCKRERVNQYHLIGVQ